MRDHLALSLAGALVLGLAIGASGGAEVAEPTSETAAPVETDDPEPVEEEPEPEPEPEFDRPSKADFELKLRKVDEACFGSAGCNTDVRIVLTNTTGIELDPSKTYELRYRVVGAEDPLLSTTEITGRDYTVNEHSLSTQSADVSLRAIVLSVSEF